MSNIDKIVTDTEARKFLRDNDGIGTEATRGAIIETLKARDFLQVAGKGKNKALRSTPKGQDIIDALGDSDIINPVMTALWEQALEAIADNKLDPHTFFEQQIVWLTKEIERAGNSMQADKNAIACPTCGKGILTRRKAKKNSNYWWGCTAYPDCKASFPDQDGKPKS